jgi:hypothetical protein
MAGGLGFCGLDRRRDPLVGDEIRACWEAADAATPARDDDSRPWVPAGFVDMDEALPPGAGSGQAEPGWSLWGDLDA